MYLPDFIIRILLKWIDVAPNGSLKENRLLRNYTKPRPKVMES